MTVQQTENTQIPKYDRGDVVGTYELPTLPLLLKGPLRYGIVLNPEGGASMRYYTVLIGTERKSCFVDGRKTPVNEMWVSSVQMKKLQNGQSVK